jgi:tyrosine-protein kinase Etk/Wzc
MALEVPQAELKPQTAAPGVHGNSAGPSDDISVVDLLIILAERKRFISWITIGFACSAVIVSLLLPKSYKAAVTLLPPQQSSPVGAALASQLGNLGGMAALAGSSFGIKNPNEMFVAMLKSRTVEDAMVQRYGLMKEYRKRYLSDARLAFEKHVTVDGSGKDGMIHISVEARDPNRAAELANGYVEQFRSLSEHLAITEASQRRLFFQKELEQAKNNLASAEEALKATQEKTGLIQLDSQSRALIESAATLRAEIAAREVQIQGMQTYATSENAQLVQAQRELDGFKAQLAKLGGSGNGGTDEFIVPKGKVPQAGIEYIRRIRDVKYNETIFEILARQFEVAKLDEAKQGALIQVVDPAIPPDRKSFPKRALIVIGATFVGLFIGIFVALLQAGFRRLKENPDTRDKLTYLRRLIQKPKYP